MKENDNIFTYEDSTYAMRLEKLVRYLKEYDPAIAKHFVDKILDVEREVTLNLEIEMLEVLQKYLRDQGYELEVDGPRMFVTKA